MRQTRFITLFVFAVVASGLSLLALGDRTSVVVLGAVLVAGGAIALTRHLSREADTKRKQELAATTGTVNTLIAGLSSDAIPLHNEVVGTIDEVSVQVDAFARGVLEIVAQSQIDNHARLESVQRSALKHRDDILAQLSGVIGIYATLQPSRPYPPFGGWAIGGDCAQRLVSLILSDRPTWIVETGSGLSTVLAAQTLELIGGEGKVISLEHESSYLERSRTRVAEHGLSHRSHIHHAPLTETTIGTESFLWYDLSGIDLPAAVDLVFIDGPPKATGPLARYPALPMLYGHLSPEAVLLMDDAARPDEKAAVDRWREEFPDLDYRYHSGSKGAIEITRGRQ
jgi:predicted O-methyltransferase YrrM